MIHDCCVVSGLEGIINGIVSFACSSGKEFVKFVNLLMNDTTFLLDESLDALKVSRQGGAEWVV